MNSPAYPSQPGSGGLAAAQSAVSASAPLLTARPLTAPEGTDMSKAVLLPAGAMGSYAALRASAKKFPAMGSALQKARSESFKSLLTSAKAPTIAARKAAQNGGMAATTQAAKIMGKAAPQLLKKGAMMGLGRVALAPIPVVGPILLAGTWLLDKDSRSLVNGLISCVAGVGFPPDGDAPPSPPRTQFLPLTSDGNRDPQIEKMDQGMTQTNTSAFNYAPKDVWPSNPAITTTPDFKGTLSSYNKMGPKAAGIADQIRGVTNSLTGASVGKFSESLPARLGPIADALDKYHSSVVPGATAAINGVTTKANEFYQKFREINNTNRAEISNSTSGYIPLRANHINAAAMDDSIAAQKAVTTEISKNNAGLSSAYSNWSVPAAPAASGASITPVSSVGRVEPVQPAAPPTPPAQTTPITPTSENDGIGKKSPLDNLLSSIPPVPSVPTPNIPTGGGIPPVPAGAPAPGLDPMAKELPLDDHKDDDKDKDKDHLKDDDKDKKDPIVEKKEGKDGHQPEGNPVLTGPAGGPPPPPPPPGADRTVRIGTKDYTFDSPRITAAIKATLEAAQNGPGIPIPQALAENGVTIPPVGHDIGQSVDSILVAKPGDVIVSDGNRNAWYLGNGEALTEQGEIKPVNEVMNFVGPNQGIFHIPEPGTPVVDPTAAPAGTAAVSTSPPVVNTTDVPAANLNPSGQAATQPNAQPVPQHQ